MTTELEVGLYIFMLAGFLGYHIITRVPPLLHTPLMSATNAIAAISLVGSLVVAGSDYSNVPNGWVCTLLGFIAVTCSSTNAVRRLPHHRPHAAHVQDGGGARAAARGGRSSCRRSAFVLALVARRRGARSTRRSRRAWRWASTSASTSAPEALRYCYIVSAAMFVLGLKGLSSPKWARSGMSLAAFGMFVAVVGTLFHPHIVTYRWIALGLGDRRRGRRHDGSPHPDDRRAAAHRAVALARRAGGVPRRRLRVLPLPGRARAA